MRAALADPTIAANLLPSALFYRDDVLSSDQVADEAIAGIRALPLVSSARLAAVVVGLIVTGVAGRPGRRRDWAPTGAVSPTRERGNMEGAPARRRGRPPTTEKSRSDMRMRISVAAVRLFAERGVAHTTAADIAAAVGISERTFWRYFTTKEDCIRPVVDDGFSALHTLLSQWPAGVRLVDHAVRQAVTPREPPAEDGAASGAPSMVDLVRLVRDQPELGSAWLGVHFDAETLFATDFGLHFAEPPDSLRMRLFAAMFNGAVRAGVEHAVQTRGDELDDRDLGDVFRAALTELPF